MKDIIYILIILFLASICLILFQQKTDNNAPIEKETIDTIYKYDTITIEKPIPKIIYKDRIIRDTLYTKDSTKTEVFIPIQQKLYASNDYRCIISGYKVNLDEMVVYPKETIVYKEKLREIAKKRPLIEYGLGCGAGYGLIKKNFDIYVGGVVKINLNR